MKTELRKKFMTMRNQLLNKSIKDEAVCNNLLLSDIYFDSSQIFCYYPLGSEINTLCIINDALFNGKRVALPLCTDKNGKMDFYYINSLSDDLSVGSFGIHEPIANKCERVKDFSGALCIVPGLTFDRYGYRLGYGKGYYDRFLQSFTSVSVGLCYNEFISEYLPKNMYDKKVDYICTDECVIKLQRRI